MALDVDICDAATFAVLRQRFVLVRRFGELGDDVPRVDEAGQKAENTEQDVDDGVSAADTALDPD